MKLHSTRLTISLLAALAMVLGGQTTWAAKPRPQLVIFKAAADFAAETISIEGQNLSPLTEAPRLRLGGVALNVVSFTDTNIVAELPVGLPDATYLLEVARGSRAAEQDSVDLTILASLQALLASVSLEDGGATLRFTGVNLEVVGGGALAINAGSVAITSVSTLNLDAGSSLNLDAGSSLNLDADGFLNLDAGATIDAQASLITLNGGGTPKPAARVGDFVVTNTLTGIGQISTGSATVLIGP